MKCDTDRNCKLINAFATRLGRQIWSANIICTRVSLKHRDFCISNWNVTLFNEKEQYHFDIAGVSSIKYRGSDTVKLNEDWKYF